MNEPENGFHAPLPEDLAPLFPSYQILSLIATGGMGAVYHAIQTSLEREVAIKILPVEFGKDPEFCKGFEAEAKAMAKLNHPNLISVYDFGEVAGMLFIVMEHVPGKSLHEACAGAAIDPAEAIRLMTGISQGLAHAHEYGILHRDIKPANILLDSHLRPKIGDFGLARPLDAEVGEGEAIFGTPGYTAPEVLQPPHVVDQRADIFSLGVLLHELLTGLLPGSGPRSVSAISQCDPRLNAVVRKATHPAPAQRYQNASEIAEALQKIAGSMGPRVLRTTSAKTSRQPAVPVYSDPSSNKGFGGVLLAMLLFVAMATLYFMRDRIFHTDDPRPDPDPVIAHNPEPVKPDPVASVPEPVDPEPDPVASVPEPVDPEPDPVASVPKPVDPEPDPVASLPEPVDPDPGTKSGDSVAVTPPQPKFDVEGFFAHARSVMVSRCDPIIAARDEALDRNLSNFRSEARSLTRTNLQEVYHEAAAREMDAYVAQCKADGNRLGEELEKPLKFKKWLVELHDEHKSKEAEIDEEMMTAFSEQRKTYLHGLGLKNNALREDDPVAADLIKAEIDKVNASPDYFAGLMLEAHKD